MHTRLSQTQHRSLGLSVAALALSLSAPMAQAQFTFFESAGANPAAIQPTVDSFRTALGALNPNVAGSFGTGRREINWDGVPNGFADPNLLPGNFFNANSPRGVSLSTPGTGFLVSANTGQPSPVLFGFPGDFQTFSAQRLFTPIASNITDVTFFVPGTSTPAQVRAFGSVFTDIEVANSVTMQFFDASNNLLVTRSGLTSGNLGLAFLGVSTSGTQFARVRIKSGDNTILSNGTLGDPNNDVVAMDDFIYAEPTAISSAPEPGTLGLLALGGLAFLRVRRRTS